MEAWEQSVLGDMGTGGAPSVDEKVAPKLAAVFPSKVAPQAPLAATAGKEPPPSFLSRNVGGINRPVWQVILFGLGGAALTAGIVSLLGKRR